MLSNSNGPKGKKPSDPTKKKVYGDPIYGKNEDITNQGERVPLSETKRDGTEPDIKDLYTNDLNTDEQEIITNQQSLDDEPEN